MTLLAPYLPHNAPDPWLCALVDVQKATRDGVYGLLQLAMRDGRLEEAPRQAICGYVREEAKLRGLEAPAPELLALWIDNLSPPLDAVAISVGRVLEDKDRFARASALAAGGCAQHERVPKPRGFRPPPDCGGAHAFPHVSARSAEACARDKLGLTPPGP